MKPPAFDYAAPASVEEVLRLLADGDDGIKLLAGGQSLMPALNFRLAAPTLLVDLGGIPSLCQVHEREDCWSLGAMVTHRTVETDPRIRQALPLLSQAMAHVAHVPIRNRGTIGGSLCHADPSAEWPALCVACDAVMVVVGPSGTRRVPARDFVHGVFATAVGVQDLLHEVHFPRWPAGRRWGFCEVSRRRGDFAIAGAAVVADFDAGACRHLRAVVLGATDRPEVLDLTPLVGLASDAGSEIGRAQIEPAVAAAAALLRVRGDQHASERYRGDIVRHVTTTALLQAFAETPTR